MQLIRSMAIPKRCLVGNDDNSIDGCGGQR
jgi:hypothetical protein